MNSDRPSFVEQSHAVDSYFSALLGTGADPMSATEERQYAPAPDPAPGVGTTPRRDHQDTGSAPTGAPTSGSAPFQVMRFRVDGLWLVIPSAQVSRVAGYPRHAAPGDPRRPWIAGRFSGEQGEVTLLDIAPIVIPPRHRAAVQNPRRESDARILLLDGGAWALVCERDVDILTLEEREVRWRTARTSRPWLAGTVMAHACGLLDVEALLALARQA